MVVALAMLWTAAACAADKEEFSEANQLLFFTDHLEGVAGDTVLHYDYTKLQPVAYSFEDSVSLTIERSAEEGDGAAATVHVQYLSGSRERVLQPFEQATGNPILLLFLQSEAYEMAQRHEGSARHFQNRIKLALENEAEVTPVAVDLDGREVAARRIRIAPYLDDPYRERFIEEAGKVYDITLAEGVPGMIYELRSTIPAAEGDEGETWEVIRFRDDAAADE